MEPISRKDARAAGLAEYFTGQPCNLGGIAVRTVSEKKCQCEAHQAKRTEAAARRYVENREYRLEKAKQRRLEKPEELKAAARAQYVANKPEYIARAKAWAEKNVEKRREVARQWTKRHPEILLVNAHKRSARKLCATPAWDRELTDFVTVEAADLARKREAATGIKWEVDHTVPLAGKNVCGLHVWNNIQVIPMSMNRRKSNRHIVA